MSRRVFLAFALVIVIAGAALLAGCGGGGSATATSPPAAGQVAILAQTLSLVDGAGVPTVRTLSLPPLQAAPGQEITLPVTVDDATGIAGAAVQLSLDKTVFACTEVTPGEWVSPQAQVVRNAAGAAIAVAGTAAAPATATPGSSRPRAAGVTLAIFRLRILATARPQSVNLKLSAVLSDAKGNTLGRTATGGTAASRAVSPRQASNLIGDLQSTGAAEVGSAIMILRVVVGLDPQPSSSNLWRWDCNKSGAVDVADAIMILRCVVGLDTWPIGTGGGATGTYDVIDLGTFPNASYSYAYGINTAGQVVGFSNTPSDGPWHAFLYSGGVLQDLGTLGGSGSIAYAISDGGQIVGSSHTAGDVGQHAFLYSGGVMRDLGTLGGLKSEAFGVNAAGQAAGYAYRADGITWHAFLSSGGGLQDLGTLGGSTSTATGINAAGQVVGYSDMPPYDLKTHAFIYSGGSLHDLGTLGGGDSQATAVNASGQVVGGSMTQADPKPWHAFLYSGGVMQDLGTLGGDNSQAHGINTAGQVVGDSNQTTGGGDHAFLFTPGGTMKDLNSLLDLSNPLNQNWLLESARAINDNGWIVGYGSHNGRQRHAFLAKPRGG